MSRYTSCEAPSATSRSPTPATWRSPKRSCLRSSYPPGDDPPYPRCASDRKNRDFIGRAGSPRGLRPDGLLDQGAAEVPHQARAPARVVQYLIQGVDEQGDLCLADVQRRDEL